jgi:hypothetical protein
MFCVVSAWENAKRRNRNVTLLYIVTDRPWVKQITVFIDTTVKTIKTVMDTEHFTRISRITLNRHFDTHLLSSLGW